MFDIKDIDRLTTKYNIKELNNMNTANEIGQMIDILADICKEQKLTDNTSMILKHKITSFEDTLPKEKIERLGAIIPEYLTAYHDMKIYMSINTVDEAKYQIDYFVGICQLLTDALSCDMGEYDGWNVDIDYLFDIADKKNAKRLIFNELDKYNDFLNACKNEMSSKWNTLGTVISTLMYDILYLREKTDE